MLLPRWFFIVSGMILVVVGVGLIAVRPRPKYERGLSRVVNLGHLWACTCILAGLAIVLVGLGVLAWPGR